MTDTGKNKSKGLRGLIGQRKSFEFVGRKEQLSLFEQNLSLSPDDKNRRFIFNVFGQGGIGKSELLEQYKQHSNARGALITQVNEDQGELFLCFEAMAKQFSKQGLSVKEFEEQYQHYQNRMHELERDDKFPRGLPLLAGQAAVRGALRAGKTFLPFGSLFELLGEEEAVASQVVSQFNELINFISSRVNDRKEADLLIRPVKTLSSLLINSLLQVDEKRPIVMFFDTYEVSAVYLDRWLRSLLSSDDYGVLPENTLITIAGRKPLDENDWSPYSPFIVSIELEPLSLEDAISFLRSRGVTDADVITNILTLSNRVPLILETMAHRNPQQTEDLLDATDTALKRALTWVEQGQKAFVISAALPRRFNRDIVAQVAIALNIDEGQVPKLFDDLVSNPFVKRHANGYAYHDLLREYFLRWKLNDSPEEWRNIHGHLVNYFKQQRDQLEVNERAGLNSELWRSLTLESLYHQICQNPIGHLLDGLNGFLGHLYRLDFAQRWAETMRQAGHDAENNEVEHWGKLLTAGLRAYAEERYGDCIAMFTALVNYSQSPTYRRSIALAWRGEIYRSLERQQEAMEDLSLAIQLDPSFTWAISKRGDLYRSLNMFDLALEDLNNALRTEPDSAWSLASRGATYIAMGNYDQALKDLSIAIKISPEYIWALSIRAEIYEMKGLYDLALQDLNVIIRLQPIRPILWINRLRLLTRKKDETARIAYIHEIEQKLPEYLPVLHDYIANLISVGKVNIKINNEQDEIAQPLILAFLKYFIDFIDRRSATVIEALRLSVWAAQDIIFIYLLDFDSADLTLERARFWERLTLVLRQFINGTTPSQAQAWRGVIEQTLAPNDLWETEEYYELSTSVVQEIMNDMQAATGLLRSLWKLLLASSLMANNWINHAVDLASTTEKPKERLVLLLRATLYKDLGRLDLALVDINEALRLFPDCMLSLKLRAGIFSDLQRIPEAISDLNQLLSIHPDDIWAVTLRGEVLLIQKEFEAALKDLTLILSIDPEDDWLYYKRSFAYHNQQDFYQKQQADLGRAIEIAQAQVARSSTNWRERFNLALYLLASGQFNESLSAYRQTLADGALRTSIVEGLEDLIEYVSLSKESEFTSQIQYLLEQSLNPVV